MSERVARRVFLADDLTGTLEVGAILKQAGVGVQIGIGGVPAGSEEQSFVIDCQARRLPGAAAFARYGAILAAVGEAAGELYLKLDSTLRGNVVSAIRATLAHYPGRRVVFCPAYPSQGRTVADGQVLVHGEPLRARSSADEWAEPVVSGVIGQVLGPLGGILRRAAGGGELARLLGAGEEGVVISCDARTEEDLRAIWGAVDNSPEPVVMAGSAGLLAVRYARRAGVGLASGELAGRAWVVACGSMNPATLCQLDGCPWTVFRCPAATAAVADSLARHGGVVLATPVERSEEDVMAWLVSVVQEISERGGASGLIVFGGDTASSILAACGIRSLVPAGEVLPGVPCSWVELGGARTPLITKAGGFGGPDMLRRLIREITK